MPARTHGQSRTRAYRAWCAMHRRVTGKDPRSPIYQAKGVAMHAGWVSFETFLDDMGPCPPGMTLDRIDNAKGYEPGNCRWATRKQQVENRDCTVRLTVEGETLSLAAWAERTGVPHQTLRRRLDRGWSVSKAVHTPLRSGGYKKKGV